MKKILTLVSAIALSVSLAQAEMKCEAGKCGSATDKKEMKCEAGKCGASDKKEMKCQSSKCGKDSKKVPTKD